MRNHLIISSIALLGSLALVQAQQGPGPVIGCSSRNGLQPPGSEACVDDQWMRCTCKSWSCQWTCPPNGCARCLQPVGGVLESSGTGGCSDPADLDDDLRAELDSSARCSAFPCNCIASGNQISHKLNVKTPEDCDKFCKVFPDQCKYWTLIKSRGICFALTNCNNPKCGYPFSTYVSGVNGCPQAPPVTQQTTTFTVTNRVTNKIAAGSVTFQNNGNSNSCKFKSFSLNPNKLQSITVPISCLPLTNIKAKLNDGTACSPYNGLESSPENVYICPNGSAKCYVSMNTPCKE